MAYNLGKEAKDTFGLQKPKKAFNFFHTSPKRLSGMAPASSPVFSQNWACQQRKDDVPSPDTWCGGKGPELGVRGLRVQILLLPLTD